MSTRCDKAELYNLVIALRSYRYTTRQIGDILDLSHTRIVQILRDMAADQSPPEFQSLPYLLQERVRDYLSARKHREQHPA